MRKKINIIISASLGIIIIGIGILAGYYYKKYYNSKSIVNENINNEVQVQEKDKISYEPKYITETSFDGTEEVPDILFTIPFKKTDSYKSNKDVVNEIEEFRLNNIRKRAEEIIDAYYNVDSISIINNYQTHKEKLMNTVSSKCFYYMENDVEKTPEEYVSDYLRIATENNVSMTSEFKTYKCMIWEDEAYYVRGLLTVDIHNTDEKSCFSDYNPYELNEGNKYTFVCDIGLISGENDLSASDMRIIDIKYYSEQDMDL